MKCILNKKRPYWAETSYYPNGGGVRQIQGLGENIWEDIKNGKLRGLKCYNSKTPTDIDFFTLGHADERNNQIQFYYFYFASEYLVVRKVLCNKYGNILRYEEKMFSQYEDPYDCDGDDDCDEDTVVECEDIIEEEVAEEPLDCDIIPECDEISEEPVPCDLYEESVEELEEEVPAEEVTLEELEEDAVEAE